MIHKRRRNKLQSGYTLIELMVTLVIAAILLTVGVPAFKTQMLKSRMSAAATDLLGGMMYAKAESIGRSNFVTLCKSNPEATACITAGGWEQGWLTFIDADQDGTIDDGDEIIQVHDAVADGMTALATADLANRITYRPNGLTNLGQTESLVICNENGIADARVITVSLLGKGSILKAKDMPGASCPS
ncbi:MAG: GspH/FimT family pseudopilin [Halioglobus sp.]|nr:GspH/FimT family pseudopilin [Halioglobus sp.]